MSIPQLRRILISLAFICIALLPPAVSGLPSPPFRLAVRLSLARPLDQTQTQNEPSTTFKNQAKDDAAALSEAEGETEDGPFTQWARGDSAFDDWNSAAAEVNEATTPAASTPPPPAWLSRLKRVVKRTLVSAGRKLENFNNRLERRSLKEHKKNLAKDMAKAEERMKVLNEKLQSKKKPSNPNSPKMNREMYGPVMPESMRTAVTATSGNTKSNPKRNQPKRTQSRSSSASYTQSYDSTVADSSSSPSYSASSSSTPSPISSSSATQTPLPADNSALPPSPVTTLPSVPQSSVPAAPLISAVSPVPVSAPAAPLDPQDQPLTPEEEAMLNDPNIQKTLNEDPVLQAAMAGAQNPASIPLTSSSLEGSEAESE